MTAGKLTRPSRLSLEAMFPYLLVGILALALALRLIALDKSLWLDEWASVRGILGGNFRYVLHAMRDEHPPFYFLLLKAWSQAGTSETVLRLPSVAFGVLTVLVVAVWLRRYTALGALLASLYLAVSPALLRNSQEVRQYALLGLLTALSFAFASCLSAAPQKRWPYLGLGCSLCIAMLTHLVGVFLIGSVAVFAALMTVDRKRLRPVEAILTFAAPGVLFLLTTLFYLDRSGVLRNTQWMPHVNLDLVAAVARDVFGFADDLWSPGAAPSSPIDLAYGVGLTALVFLAALVVFGRWRTSYPFLAAALAYWLGIVVCSLAARPILLSKTVLPGLIPFVGFVAVQIGTVRPRGIKAGLALIVAALAVVLGLRWATYTAWAPVEDWKLAASRIDSKWQPGDLIVAYPAYAAGPVKYYMHNAGSQAVIGVNPGTPAEQLERQIGQTPASTGGVAAAPALFLILRADSTAQTDPGTFRELLALLKRRSGSPYELRSALIGSTDAAIEKDLLAGLAAEFGPPLSFENSGSLAWVSYRGEPK